MKDRELHLHKRWIMQEYITKLGDTFESISYYELGSENYIEDLINLNREYIKTVIFKSGVRLELPEKKSTISKQISPWRKT